MPPSSIPLAIALAILASDSPARSESGPTLTVEACPYDRHNTPIRLEISRIALPEPFRPPAVRMRESGTEGPPLVGQLEPLPASDHLRLTFVLPGPTPAGTTRTFRLEPADDTTPPPQPLDFAPDGALELHRADGRPIFRYNVSPLAQPGGPPTMTRGAYIHPAFSPDGALITGDFSKFHPHHRGFFLAYAKARSGSTDLDFWNIHADKAKVFCDRIGRVSNGPVTARFEAFHRWEAKGGRVVLNERWDVESYAIPGNPYYLFDLTSTQQAVGEPLELIPYRYGGMAYRGPDPFQPRGVLAVLNSEGHTRADADQKPARWVDLTGPIADGETTYAGALLCDHPENPNHPTPARIHPTTLPFISWVPAHDIPVTIATDHPTIFRYRILIHDGRPDRERDEQTWRDFAQPPVARLAWRGN